MTGVFTAATDGRFGLAFGRSGGNFLLIKIV